MRSAEELKAAREKKDHEIATRIMVRARYEPTTADQIEWAMRCLIRNGCRFAKLTTIGILVFLVACFTSCTVRVNGTTSSIVVAKKCATCGGTGVRPPYMTGGAIHDLGGGLYTQDAVCVIHSGEPCECVK